MLVDPESPLLSPQQIELIERENALRLLDGCGVDVVMTLRGWSAEGLDREIVNPDMEIVIRRCLAVLRGRKDLWARRTRFKFLANETEDDPRSD